MSLPPVSPHSPLTDARARRSSTFMGPLGTSVSVMAALLAGGALALTVPLWVFIAVVAVAGGVAFYATARTAG